MAGNYANELVNKFFNNKTIQKSYNFIVSISNANPVSDDRFKGPHENLKDFETSTESFPIKPTHVKAVTLPNPQTKFEMQHMGALVKRHPMFDFENPVIKMEFTEDAYHTIQRFILWMSKRRVNGYGEYYPLSESSCIRIEVDVVDDTGEIATTHIFKNCGFANATEPTYSYDSNEAISVSMDFSFELYEMYIYNIPDNKTKG